MDGAVIGTTTAMTMIGTIAMMIVTMIATMTTTGMIGMTGIQMYMDSPIPIIEGTEGIIGDAMTDDRAC
jgi:hypothetical protein